MFWSLLLLKWEKVLPCSWRNFCHRHNVVSFAATRSHYTPFQFEGKRIFVAVTTGAEPAKSVQRVHLCRCGWQSAVEGLCTREVATEYLRQSIGGQENADPYADHFKFLIHHPSLSSAVPLHDLFLNNERRRDLLLE